MKNQFETSWDKLLNKIYGWFDSLILNLPNLLLALLVFIIAYWVSKNLHGWVNKNLRKFIRQASIRGLVSNVVSIIVIMMGIILALNILNLDGTLKSLLAGAGVAGLAISLALQGTLSNTFSGLFIAIKDEINIGDWIETNGYSGKVIEISLRNTKIKEADNNIVVLPNKLITDNPFKNYALTRRIRTTITCGVGYESDLEQVKKLTIEAIHEIFPPNDGENVEFYYTEFGESSIDFLLRFWVDAKEKLTALEVKSDAIQKIKDTFNEHGINIPFPIRTLINENKDTHNTGSRE